jgi:hypothetical protein
MMYADATLNLRELVIAAAVRFSLYHLASAINLKPLSCHYAKRPSAQCSGHHRFCHPNCRFAPCHAIH